MSKRLAIRGHSTRGNEVIEILKMLGGKNNCDCPADNLGLCYLIDDEFDICAHYFGYDDYEDGKLNIFTLEEFLEKYPFKVGDKAVYMDDNDIVVISEIMWDDTVGDIFYNVKRIDDDDCFLCPPEVLKPYKETNMKSNKCTYCVYAVNNDHCGLRGFRSNFNVSYCSAQNVDKLPNGFELQEDGYFSWVNKKPKYPKTFEECLNLLYCKLILRPIIGHKAELLLNLEKLLICRDAYWKILGEEMGLGKSWEPDWKHGKDKFYCICTTEGEIVLGEWYIDNKILAFPTEKMRDVFYENFKELIEQCKKLL